MKAEELDGRHLGGKITVEENGNKATGFLISVQHRGSIITDRTFDGSKFQSMGLTSVELEFLGDHSITCTPNAAVTLEYL